MKKLNNIVVLYHKNCFDGFSAAWAAWKKFGDKAEYVAVELQTPAPKNLKGKNVYMIDFAYSPKITENLMKICASVTIIDHHISNSNSIKNVSDYSYDINHSGAVLAWKYFHPKRSVPKLLRYVEDNDLWKFRLPFAKEISVALDLHNGFDFKKWSKIVSDFEDREKFKKYIEEGKIVSRYRDIIIQRIMAGAEKVNFENQKAFAVNSPFWQSEIGNFIVKNKKAIGIIWSRKSGRIRVSLRSNKKNDVSKLAEKYGGGGHKVASGFSLDIKKPFPWKYLN